MRPELISLRTALDGQPIVSRFAPSVTGYLHLGHLVNAMYVWGITRALGGKVILRMEDHDRSRFRPEFETAILEDLKAFGFEWDIPHSGAFSEPQTPFRQSDQPERYKAVLDFLRKRAHVYACTCSRKDLESRLEETNESSRYDGHCRRLNQAPEGAQFRVVIPDREIGFLDHRLGWQTHNPAGQCGDLRLSDRLGQFSYQFCVVVDDWMQGVNLVIRGEDILESTGRQLALMQLLGIQQTPKYLHHTLLMGPDGRKLSKKDFSEPIHEMLRAGKSPQELLGKTARMAGLMEKEREISIEELPDLFLKG